MKRALEADFEVLNETSQALLLDYSRALKMSQYFFNHIHELYDREAMYAFDRCYIELKNPAVSFEFINQGLEDGNGKDEWVIEARDNKDEKLAAFFNYTSDLWYGNFMTMQSRRIAHSLLADYFMGCRGTDLVIDTWGDDNKIQGGTIGASTQWQWVPEAREERSEEEDEEEESNDDADNE